MNTNVHNLISPKVMTREQLDQFIKERPLLNLEGLSKEAGKSRKALTMSLPTDGEISGKILEWLLPVLQKYGFKL